MKKSVILAAAVSIITLSGLAYGEMGGYSMGQGMRGGQGMGQGMMGGQGMGQGMMGGQGMGPGMMGECGMGGQMMEHHMSQHLMALNLDDQQRALIGEIKSRMMKETIQRNADMRIVQIDLRDLLRKDPVDMKAVEAKVKQLEMMRTEMHLSHIKGMEDIKTKLTPEQRKKFRKMIEFGPMMQEMEMKHE